MSSKVLIFKRFQDLLYFLHWFWFISFSFMFQSVVNIKCIFSVYLAAGYES